MPLVSEVLENVLLKLREDISGSEFWTTPELLDYVNEGMRFMAIDGSLFETVTGLPITANVASYALPSDFISMKRAEFGEKLIYHSHPEEWDERNESWQDDTGTPVEYTLQLNDGYIRLYPKPDTASTNESASSEYGTYTILDESADTIDLEPGTFTGLGTDVGDSEYGIVIGGFETSDNLKIYYNYIPSDLTESSELPYVLSKDLSVLENYVIWQCYDKEGATQDIQRGQYYYQRFAQRYNMLKRRDELPRSHTVIGSATHSNKLSMHRYPLLPDNYPRRW